MNICENYAKDYSVLLNVSKSKLMHFGKKVKLFVMTYSVCSIMPLRPNTFSNVYILEAIYFDNFIENIDNTVNYILSITNKLMADFSYAESTTL